MLFVSLSLTVTSAPNLSKRRITSSTGGYSLFNIARRGVSPDPLSEFGSALDVNNKKTRDGSPISSQKFNDKK